MICLFILIHLDNETISLALNSTNADADIDYLKTSVNDWGSVKSKWKATFMVRQSIFKTLNVLDLFEQFPCLNEPDVNDLVRFFFK